MKVVQLFKDYFPPTPGGVEILINEIAHSMDGIDFSVLTSSGSRRLVIDDDRGVRVIRAPELARVAAAPIVPSWARWLRRLRPDVIHAHLPNPLGDAAVLLSRTKAPLVVSYHADITRETRLKSVYRPLLNAFLRRAQRIVVGSPALADNLPGLAPLRDRVVVIPYGIDPDEWSARPALADELRERYPGPLVVFLGRLRQYKGVDVLIDAMRSVDATLLVAGDGPLREELEAAAGERVRFVGEIADAERAAYMHAADVFVLPGTNRGEAFGIVQLEAMAAGTPCVSTELGTGTSWVNVHGETGLVVPPGDATALAGAINSLLGDAAKRAAMSDAARRRVSELFTKERMLAALRDVYAEVLQER